MASSVGDQAEPPSLMHDLLFDFDGAINLLHCNVPGSFRYSAAGQAPSPRPDPQQPLRPSDDPHFPEPATAAAPMIAVCRAETWIIDGAAEWDAGKRSTVGPNRMDKPYANLQPTTLGLPFTEQFR
jgi:hypothetical protein